METLRSEGYHMTLVLSELKQRFVYKRLMHMRTTQACAPRLTFILDSNEVCSSC